MERDAGAVTGGYDRHARELFCCTAISPEAMRARLASPSAPATLLRPLLGALGLGLALASAAPHAAPVRSHAAEAELVADKAAIVPGQTLAAALRIKLDPGWHVYWKNPGDSGMPPTLEWRLPAGVSASEMQFPYPARIPIAHLVNFGYDGEVLFPVAVQVPESLRTGDTLRLAARAEWLECKESCLPAAAELTLELPVAGAAGPSRWSPLFEAARARLPSPLPAAGVSAQARSGAVELRVPALARCSGGDFFPEQEQVFVNAKIERIAGAGDVSAWRLPLEGASPGEVRGVAVCATANGATTAHSLIAAVVGVTAANAAALPQAGAASVSMTGTGAASLSFTLALAFAFGGGLLLNLMPCVFPVLGIKVLGLAHGAAQPTGVRAAHAGAFVAGVATMFLALAGLLIAARAAGEQLGWGFQLQSPWVVTGLSLLFFLLALNLSGWFEWGTRTQTLAGTASIRFTGPFFDGLLAALVASPCTAPFMGAALGYTLSQPPAMVLAVFGALALGMAAPYASLVLAPRWVHRLPRPGPWMQTAKRVLAWPLYATVAWLAWVLYELSGADALVRLGLVLAAIVLAIRFARGAARGMPVKAIGTAIVAIGIVWIAAAFEPPPAQAAAAAASGNWQPWSEARVAELRAEGKAVFVDFTAAWCVTCQVNKHAVLDTDKVSGALREAGVVTLRADWTRRDAAITRTLATLGRNGVPVYAYYAPDGRVTILPELLTQDIVIEAIRRKPS